MPQTDKAVIAVVSNSSSGNAPGILERAFLALSESEGERSGTAKRVKEKAAELETIEVQYNPSSLSVQADAGRKEYPGVQPGDGKDRSEDMISQSAAEEEITLSVELILDGEETKEKMERLLKLSFSQTSAQILFAWGTFCFQGRIVSMRASYTMFLPSGAPVRGKISMTVQSGSGDGRARYWEKQFDRMAEAGGA